MPKSGRRWRYLGPETHYGYTYHIWQNDLTKRKFAWDVETYRSELTRETV